MTKSKLSLVEVAAIAHEVVDSEERIVTGAVPSSGESDYTELLVTSTVRSGRPQKRLSIGVHRSESADSIRKHIARAVAAAD